MNEKQLLAWVRELDRLDNAADTLYMDAISKKEKPSDRYRIRENIYRQRLSEINASLVYFYFERDRGNEYGGRHILIPKEEQVDSDACTEPVPPPRQTHTYARRVVVPSVSKPLKKPEGLTEEQLTTAYSGLHRLPDGWYVVGMRDVDSRKGETRQTDRHDICFIYFWRDGRWIEFELKKF